ncbi:beta-N-acetylhexosaminidase [Wenjunlia vitaminophila]|uniref:beta-N-acetylhexosaminidase n=1 Tax=Wenjunlia vitaminophila TaxID=76728 RepID=A0A0T6LP61_WENVI|nr:glycoside hydrolase family 3 protein [Wenjunlia vitaminophila]KRV47813.1 beta-N-acetylhexosaminidase [Wenjunlia vitaminophila]
MQHQDPRHRPSRRTLLTATAVATASLASLSGPAFAVGATGSQTGDAGDDRDRVAALLGRMSLEEKVGQLFVMRVYGSSASDPAPEDVAANRKEIGVDNAVQLIERYHVGGIIYFAWAHNTRDPHQIADLSNGIQRAGQAQRTPIPLMISVDQEHGSVARIGAPATMFPGAMALGADGRARDSRIAALIAGSELAAMGVRQNYAPVADVNVNAANPVIHIRSFGADPEAVADLVAAQVDGYQRAGIASCAKHFPGHGDTRKDSHFELPIIHHTREEWERLDAPPFRAAIDRRIDSIMTAHIVVPALDPSGDPATLSRPILTGVLREELGYDGVVITDSLGMEGVREKYGDDRVPVLALKAGCDQLLNPPNLNVAWNAVLDAVHRGELTEERLDQSLRRILELKLRRGLFREPYVSHAEVQRTVGNAQHLAAADKITERTTTLLRNEGGLLPLTDRHRTVLVVGADPASPSGTGGPPTTVLARALTALGHPADALSTGTTPDRATIDRAVAAAGTHDVVVVTTADVAAESGQQALVRALVAAGRPVVHLAIRKPYDLAYLTEVGVSLATYSWTDVAMRAVAKVIAGEVSPTGKLPVPIPSADDPDATLYPLGHGLRW